MGFFGDFVLARSDRPLLEQPLFSGGFTCNEGHADCVAVCRLYEDGWQALQILHGLPDNDDDRWLSRLVAATGSPTMIASVMDSDLCAVRGRTPEGIIWFAHLDPAMSADYGITAPSAPDTVDRIAAWAAEAQYAADRATLTEVLAKKADPFAEELFFELIAACGLTAVVEPEVPPTVPDQEESKDEMTESDIQSPLAHPGHRPTDDCPRGPALEIEVLNLERGEHLVLQCASDPNCYAQVWLRPDGTHQLEYRDCSPAEHYQTQTLSAEKVVAALAGWTAGATDWRDSFQWESIGAWFTD